MSDGAKFLILCWALILLLGQSGPERPLVNVVLAWVCISGLFVMWRALRRADRRRGGEGRS